MENRFAVNGRTFQVLHAVRNLARTSTPATVQNIGDLFRAKKAQDKGTYATAYLSPSTISDILNRLCHKDYGLLDFRDAGKPLSNTPWDPPSKKYHLTPKGSLVADSLDLLTVDTCSTDFLLQYKKYAAEAYF
jgi:hypothetical protein